MRNIEKKIIQKIGKIIFSFFSIKLIKLSKIGRSDNFSGEKIAVINGITEAIPIISNKDNNKNKKIIKKNFF